MKANAKRIVSLFLVIVLLVSFCPETFAVSREAEDAADALHRLGIFNGTGTDADGKPIYELDRTPTREEAITMLVRLLGAEGEAKSGNWSTPFTDVSDWAKPYVGYAYENGLTNGTSATTFSGSDVVSAAQYLTFVLRALHYQSGEDFQWDSAWELSDRLGITRGQYHAGSAFVRGDVAIVSWSALSQKLKNRRITLLDSINSALSRGLMYSVSALSVTDFDAAATVNTIEACTLHLSFYSEDETQLLLSSDTEVSAGLSLGQVRAEIPDALPQYFVAEAVLRDGTGEQLCDPFKTMKYTQRYALFEAKTVEDFESGAIILNYDGDGQTNFAVLDDRAVRVDCSDTVNRCEPDGDVFTFANANEQLSGIGQGDVVAIYAENEALVSIVVKEISRSGSMVSITASRDYELRDMYQFIKLDIQGAEISGGFSAGLAPVRYAPAQSSGVPEDTDPANYRRRDYGTSKALASQLAKPEWMQRLQDGVNGFLGLDEPVYTNGSNKLEGQAEFKISENVSAKANVSATLTYSLGIDYDVRLFGPDYYSVEVSTDFEGAVGVSLGAKAEYDSTADTIETFKLSPKDLTLDLGKYYIPTPVPALAVTAEVLLPLKLSVQGEFSWEGNCKITSGFVQHRDAKGVYRDSFEDKSVSTDQFKIGAEGSVSFGVNLAVGVSFLAVLSADISAELGMRIEASTEKSLGSAVALPEDRHLCGLCFEGEFKCYLTVGVGFSFGIESKLIDLSIGDEWTILEVEFLKRDFYFSVDKLMNGDSDFFGWKAKCPNYGYRVEVTVKGSDGEKISGHTVRVFGAGAAERVVKSGDTLYLPNGAYTAYATAPDGTQTSAEFTVDGEARQVEMAFPTIAPPKPEPSIPPSTAPVAGSSELSNVHWDNVEVIYDSQKSRDHPEFYAPNRAYPGFMAWSGVSADENDHAYYRVTMYDESGNEMNVIHITSGSYIGEIHSDMFVLVVEESGTYTFSVEFADDWREQNPVWSEKQFSQKWTYMKPMASLPAPTGMSLSEQDSQKAVISWNIVPSAAGYETQCFYADTPTDQPSRKVVQSSRSWEYNWTAASNKGNSFNAKWAGRLTNGIVDTGYYYFQIRSLSRDITKVFHSDWSDYFVLYFDGWTFSPV